MRSAFTNGGDLGNSCITIWRVFSVSPHPLACSIFPPRESTPHIPHSSRCVIIDLLAFLIILVTARRSGKIRYPGMPSILDVIVRDSTQYFMLIFFFQVLAQLFLFFAPVGDTRYVRGWLAELCSSCTHCQDGVKLLPGG